MSYDCGIMPSSRVRALIGGSLVLIVVLTMFVTPGWRHSHEQGEHWHSHGHWHQHAHSHSHSRHSHIHEQPAAESSASATSIRSSQSHVHITILCFEVVLPDTTSFQGYAAGTSRHLLRHTSVIGGVVHEHSPSIVSHLIQLLLLVGIGCAGSLPWQPQRKPSIQALWAASFLGRLPDAPLTPPPEST